jgi:hypothetical protein
MSNPVPNSIETKSALFWGAFILGLITINLGIAALAIYMAVGDSSFRPLPNYSSQAVDWQNHKDLLEASDRLDWNIQIARLGKTEGVGIWIKDAKGNPVQGCTGKVEAYHFTRSGQSQSVEIAPEGSQEGVYWAAIRIDREGKWQISLDLRGPQQERYVSDRVVDWSLP